MWEHIDELSMMVDSLRTPNVACKVDHDKKTTKMDHYMDEFLDELQH